MPDRSALKQQVSAPEEKKEETTTPEEVSAGRDNQFTKEDLDKVWQEMLDEKEREEKSTEIRIFQSDYSLNEKDIVVNITNEALMPTFEKMKFDLNAALRDALENDQISVSAKVIEVEKEKMRYTDSEKFDYLKEKYPALKDLQEKLGLDPEF